MAKQSYEIHIHYPEDSESETKLKINLGKAYLGFIETYILSLNISNEQKREILSEIFKKVKG